MTTALKPQIAGASFRGETTEFNVWAPNASRVLLQIDGRADTTMQRQAGGVFTALLPCRPGDRYSYVLEGGKPLPDPVSRLLPQGVHGPTEIVDPASFEWHDDGWRGVELCDYILYELHVGTFTASGTFDGVIERLGYLKDLGITAIELMPVAAFPGRRNWGYDGVSMYAVQASYGGPEGLRRLVDAAHGAGLAVVLDVVYNHLGNEGNYLRGFGPYFTDRHTTPWGDAINYDAPGCEGVRRYVVENALYWIREYHLDGLRLDAVQTIRDDSRYHILAEIQDNVQELARELGRRVCVMAESDENDPRLLLPRDGGGYGLDGLWSDDFHHAVHTVLTGEDRGYYEDFGRREQIVRALNQGFVFQGEFFKFWKAPRGKPPEGMTAEQHVICDQNHDQVGNRAKGERLSALAPRGALKLVSALLLLAPETPLLFMGEEYGETAPFQFFTDYGDPQLQEAVREGRRREFRDFKWEEVPDPQDPATFERSRLSWRTESADPEVRHKAEEMLDWYRQLIGLRRGRIVSSERTCHAELRGGVIRMQAPAETPRVFVIAEFPDSQRAGDPGQNWRLTLACEQDGYRVRVYEA